MIRCRFVGLTVVVPSFAVLCALAAACARPPTPDAVASSSASPSAAPVAAPSASAAASSAPSASASSAAAAPSASSAPPGGAPETPLEGLDLIEQARVIYRVAVCGAGDVPSKFSADVVAKHCTELEHAYGDYRKQWVEVAEPFLASLRPKNLPSTVVYPFGGGDLASALATFPDATELTTISLEPTGDIRPIDHLPPERLAHELSVHRSHLERLFEKAHSRTDNLDKEAHADVPGEVVFDLAALVVHGYEPVSLRYFKLQPDGTLAYVTQADIDAQAHHPVALRKLFDDVELRFRPTGGAGPTRVFRHIAYNLDDTNLKDDPSLLAHLNAKGKVAAMTKAASHLLWNDHFSTIRGWLIDHTDWMISDSTGIPPRFAQPAGFVQDTYGTFDGPALFGTYDKRDADDLKQLFKTEPTRELAFRYGYPDQAGHAHLMVTHRDANVAVRNEKSGSAPPAEVPAPSATP